MSAKSSGRKVVTNLEKIILRVTKRQMSVESHFLLDRLRANTRRDKGELREGHNNFAAGKRGGSMIPTKGLKFYPARSGSTIEEALGPKYKLGQNITTVNLVSHAKKWLPFDRTIERAVAETKARFGG